METNTKGTASTVNLAELVAKFKVTARDALRAKLVSARLAVISGLNTEIAGIQKTIDRLNHTILVENYEIGVLDVNHPDYAETKADKEATVKECTDEVTACTKDVAEVQKQIDKQNEGIAKIQSGETKVSREELDEMVNKMLDQYAKNGVSA